VPLSVRLRRPGAHPRAAVARHPLRHRLDFGVMVLDAGQPAAVSAEEALPCRRPDYFHRQLEDGYAFEVFDVAAQHRLVFQQL